MSKVRIASFAAIVGAFFLALFFVHLIKSVQTEMTGGGGSQLALLRLLVLHCLGLLLFLYGNHLRLINFCALFLAAIFFLYMGLVVELTARDSLPELMLSQAGVVTWFALGVWLHLAIVSLKVVTIGYATRLAWIIVSVIRFLPLIVLGASVVALSTYLESLAKVPGYQFIAANVCILLVTVLYYINNLSYAEQQKRLLSTGNIMLTAYISAGTALTYFVARMNSMAIVAVWLVLAPLALFQLTRLMSIWTRLASVAVFLSVGFYAIWEFVLADLMQFSRFGQLETGSLSSIIHRLDIFQTFYQQFENSPVFGNFRAETVAGLPEGRYVHSIPFSLLTHTGIVGFSLVFSLMFLELKTSYHSIQGSSRTTSRELMLEPLVLLAVCFLGTVFAFFTWMPFWFCLGYGCVRSITPIPQD